MHCPSSSVEIPVWPYAHGHPVGLAKIKVSADDFIVEEQLPFEVDGSGEHAFLQIQKCGENTEYVARLLARFAAVRQRDVSYAGLKDRHAKTTQWFSIWLPGKEDPDWKQLETDQLKVLQILRHARKLKRGVLSGNHFKIVIRDFLGNQNELNDKLQQVKEHGIPNYFGSQRFGREGKNVEKALSLFTGLKVKREQRSIYLSAARSFLFNSLLSKRVLDNSWNKALSGDVLMFDQSNSYFTIGQLDDNVLQRIKTGEVHPGGMMFGKGKQETSLNALLVEEFVIKSNQAIVEGLIKFDLSFDRRALRVFAKDLSWEFRADSSVALKFFLPSGSYATSLIRELVDV